MSATHGWWCNSVTWPTKCPSCGGSVFFFQCDCESKVFFNELGPPWPIHDCESSWARSRPRTRDSSGAITVEISPGITVRRVPERRVPDNFSIASDTVSRARKRIQQRDPIVAINPNPDSGPVTVIGILREEKREVNVVTSLRLPSNSSMVSAFLGPLARGRWGKITIHRQSSNEDVIQSYTAWVPSEILADDRNARGATVMATLSAFFVPQVGTFWICDDYEVLG